jgi:hypothetical protein
VHLWSFFGVLQDNTLELYNSNFVSEIYKIPEDLGIISPCQQDDMPHLHKYFVVWALAQEVSVLDALAIIPSAFSRECKNQLLHNLVCWMVKHHWCPSGLIFFMFCYTQCCFTGWRLWGCSCMHKTIMTSGCHNVLRVDINLSRFWVGWQLCACKQQESNTVHDTLAAASQPALSMMCKCDGFKCWLNSRSGSLQNQNKWVELQSSLWMVIGVNSELQGES